MSTATCPTINVREASERQAAGARLIDVRTPAEFREAHAVGAENVPLDQIDPASLAGDHPILFICQSGARSRKACEQFQAAETGVESFTIDGGTVAWQAANQPVERGRKTISLERQVRITAGFLALLGAALGYFVDVRFVGLSAFIGAGLMFAGITDTCGMGMMLAKMPWNR